MSGGIALGLLLAFFACVGCQGGYPITATQCDQWCNATQSFSCHPVDPAGCVLTCSRQGGDAPACHAELDALLTCLSGPSLHGMDCDTWVLANSGSLLAPLRQDATLPSCYAEEVNYELCAEPYAEPGRASSALWL